MANVILDFVRYMDDEGRFDAQIIHELTRGLNVTFDDVDNIDTTSAMRDEIISEIPVEFTGPYMDLVTLIDRYEEDPGTRPGLITTISNIHK